MNLHYCVPLNLSPLSANFLNIRDPCKSQTIPSLGEEEILKISFLPTTFLSHALLLLHHQIAQRDGKKLLFNMITAVSRILCLDFDFPENCTHLNQVFVKYRILCLTLTSLSYYFESTIPFLPSSAYEPDALV